MLPHSEILKKILVNYPLGTDILKVEMKSRAERDNLDYILRQRRIVDFGTPVTINSGDDYQNDFDSETNFENVSEKFHSTPKTLNIISGTKRRDKLPQQIENENDNSDFQTPPRKKQRVSKIHTTPVSGFLAESENTASEIGSKQK